MLRWRSSGSDAPLKILHSYQIKLEFSPGTPLLFLCRSSNVTIQFLTNQYPKKETKKQGNVPPFTNEHTTSNCLGSITELPEIKIKKYEKRILREWQTNKQFETKQFLCWKFVGMVQIAALTLGVLVQWTAFR